MENQCRIAGNFELETGSIWSASTTTQSCATGDFLKVLRKAPNWRGSVRRFVLRDGIVTVGRSFLRIFLWPRNPVSRKRRPREAETRFECRLRRRKSEHLVLPRPRGGHVGEAGHSHATRQPPRDGCFHEIGRQEGKRDHHVDLPNAAPLALGDAFASYRTSPAPCGSVPPRSPMPS
jgi:hypothetical protein